MEARITRVARPIISTRDFVGPMSSLGVELTLEFAEPVSSEILCGILRFGQRKVAMNVVRSRVAAVHVAYVAWYASLLEIEEFLFDLGRMGEARSMVSLESAEEAPAGMRWWPLGKRRPGLRPDVERPARRASDVHRFRFVNGELLQARLVEVDGPNQQSFLESPSGVRLGFPLTGLSWYGPARPEH